MTRDLGSGGLDEENLILLGSFWFGRCLESFLIKEVKMDRTKINPVDMDSSRRELSIGDLGFVATFSVFSGKGFSCVSTYWRFSPAVLSI